MTTWAANLKPIAALSGLLLAALCLAGCVNQPSTPLVSPLPNRDVAALNSDDVVRVMRRAGFSDEQILEFGTDLRNQLATSGAAQIRIGENVEAMFAVSGSHLHVSSRLRGSFIYDVKTGRIR